MAADGDAPPEDTVVEDAAAGGVTGGGFLASSIGATDVTAGWMVFGLLDSESR